MEFSVGKFEEYMKERPGVTSSEIYYKMNSSNREIDFIKITDSIKNKEELDRKLKDKIPKNSKIIYYINDGETIWLHKDNSDFAERLLATLKLDSSKLERLTIYIVLFFYLVSMVIVIVILYNKLWL